MQRALSADQTSALRRGRELAPRERALIDFLLTPSFPGRDELRQQSRLARVIHESTEGGPLIELVVDRSAVKRAPVKRRVPVEAEGRDVDGKPLHVLLHVVDGFVSELELYREDSQPVQRFPRPEDLSIICLDLD